MPRKSSRPKRGWNKAAIATPHEFIDGLAKGAARGRGAGLNPGNRYERVRLSISGEFLDHDRAERAADAGKAPEELARPCVATTILNDATQTVINAVDSPDLGFRWSINPYRGCEHGCIYCYARPTHENLGMSSGLDFETKITAKRDAPALLAKELDHPRWKGEPIMMAGVTDVYQPIERELRITRGCLEAMAARMQPVTIVTKNRLVTRDIDLLSRLAKKRAVGVALSVTTLDHDLAVKMEPRASAPKDRLRAMRELTDAGVPVIVMVAPIIPGLTDHETPRILKAAAEHGATNAAYVLLRLPWQIKALFLDWLQRHYPERAGRVEAFVRESRGGELYDARWGVRQRGEGDRAEQIGAAFKVFKKRYGLTRPLRGLSSDSFRPLMTDGDSQFRLF